ncbi:hypothetical protein DFH05DRAFT_1519648 [Lentinula detonsa]|uniref:BAH domain-containing protein n=1 Tax=Lentinula detonsa TaxID=2804962 RepID=A0A9W8U3K5_9AGAR|nr:hypothetical protein DFH05DRAFT_1519648 [Lentinula detonsa]
MPPVLRVRTRKICYDIREKRSPTTKRRRVANKRDREKSPPDPLLLGEIWKDMVANESGNVVERYTIFKDDEGNKVRVRPGSIVFVQNEASQQAFKRGDDNNVLLWLGTVMEIRSDVNGTLCKIRWFYSFEHARPHLARLGGMGEEWTMNYEAGVGPHELFDSDHFDVIDVDAILDVAQVHRYIQTEPQQPWFSVNSWYTRGSLSTVGQGTITRLTPMRFRPHQTVHRQRVYYHVEELTHQPSGRLENPLSRIIRGFGWESKIENAIGWSQVGTLAVTEEGVTADAITSNLSIEEKVDVFEQDSAHFSSMMDQVSSQLALTRLDSDISQAAVDRFLTSEIFSEPIPKPFIDLRSSSTAGVDWHEEESRTEGDFASLDPDVSQAAVDHFLSNGIFSEDIPTSFRASGGSSPVHEIQSECDVSSDEDLGRLDGEVSDSAIDRYLTHYSPWNLGPNALPVLNRHQEHR